MAGEPFAPSEDMRHPDDLWGDAQVDPFKQFEFVSKFSNDDLVLMQPEKQRLIQILVHIAYSVCCCLSIIWYVSILTSYHTEHIVAISCTSLQLISLWISVDIFFREPTSFLKGTSAWSWLPPIGTTAIAWFPPVSRGQEFVPLIRIMCHRAGGTRIKNMKTIW